MATELQSLANKTTLVAFDVLTFFDSSEGNIKTISLHNNPNLTKQILSDPSIKDWVNTGDDVIMTFASVTKLVPSNVPASTNLMNYLVNNKIPAVGLIGDFFNECLQYKTSFERALKKCGVDFSKTSPIKETNEIKLAEDVVYSNGLVLLGDYDGDIESLINKSGIVKPAQTLYVNCYETKSFYEEDFHTVYSINVITDFS